MDNLFFEPILSFLNAKNDTSEMEKNAVFREIGREYTLHRKVQKNELFHTFKKWILHLFS